MDLCGFSAIGMSFQGKKISKKGKKELVSFYNLGVV